MKLDGISERGGRTAGPGRGRDEALPPPLRAGRARLGGSVALGGPALALQARAPTAESPMGPFYPLNRLAENDADLTRLAGRPARAQGEVIELTGRVLDLRGNPIAGARLELWQANAAGRYMHEADPATAPLDPDFQGFARSPPARRRLSDRHRQARRL